MATESSIEIRSSNQKFWSDLIKWMTEYPDGEGTTIVVPDSNKSPHANIFRFVADNEQKILSKCKEAAT